MPNKLILYVLELADGCYYVGITYDFSRRMSEHFDGAGYGGSLWTKAHKPKAIAEVVYDVDSDAEDNKTIEMMKLHGWEKVRGGRWCCPNMRYPPKEMKKTLKPAKFSDEDFD